MVTIDNLSPALRSWWHPVAVSEAVTATPMRAHLLGEAWVLVRLGHTVAAFVDRCPHRGVRLSGGAVVEVAGEAVLQCPYHGWAFTADGACASIPTLETVPSGARFCATAAATVRERYGLVWLAPEAPATAMLEFPEAEDTAFVVRSLSPRRMRTGAAQLMENNLDWSHIPFVHRETFGRDSVLPRPEDVTVSRRDWLVTFRHVARLEGGRWSAEDAALHESWVGAPFTSRLRVELPGGRVNSWFQTIQPETERSSLVYQFIAVNDLAPEQMDAEVDFNNRVLDEDLGVLELIDSPSLDLDADAVVHVTADRASTAYRRLLRDVVGRRQPGPPAPPRPNGTRPEAADPAAARPQIASVGG